MIQFSTSFSRAVGALLILVSAHAAQASTMLLLDGGTVYEVPMPGFPASNLALKDRAQTSFWKLERETVESAKKTFSEGKKLRSVKSYVKGDFDFTLPDLVPSDCGIEESWKKTAKRLAVDKSFKVKTMDAKTKAKHFWNVKGFEVPAEFSYVDPKEKNSFLKELVNKSNGDLNQAAEFVSGDKRLYIIPLGSDDEFRVYYNVYYREAANAGLKTLAKIDFVESCP